ncbi:MAG: hypothetical protein C4539_07440 [Ignavibacteriales bacterium]|nr:MAG: hypothetical protein C4539_07440 [Ignavibacteriales bacterium]
MKKSNQSNQSQKSNSKKSNRKTASTAETKKEESLLKDSMETKTEDLGLLDYDLADSTGDREMKEHLTVIREKYKLVDCSRIQGEVLEMINLLDLIYISTESDTFIDIHKYLEYPDRNKEQFEKTYWAVEKVFTSIRKGINSFLTDHSKIYDLYSSGYNKILNGMIKNSYFHKEWD